MPLHKFFTCLGILSGIAVGKGKSKGSLQGIATAPLLIEDGDQLVDGLLPNCRIALLIELVLDVRRGNPVRR